MHLCGREERKLKRIRNNAFVVYCKELLDIYIRCKVARSAAQLSYFLTLSIFPTLICIHYMLVTLLPGLSLTFDEIKHIIPQETFNAIMEYVKYISAHSSKTLLTAGILLMATTSAAAFRSIHSIMADIQGGSRFQGVFTLIFSFFFSVLFMAVIYFSAVVMVTGDWLIRFLTNTFPILAGFGVWPLIRFPILFLIFIVMIYSLYRLTAPKELKGTFFPGAILAAVILITVSVIFSQFIGFSSRYPLVYGSLAAVIIYMLWMYVCGQILIMGNAFNVVLRRHRAMKAAVELSKYSKNQ